MWQRNATAIEPADPGVRLAHARRTLHDALEIPLPPLWTGGIDDHGGHVVPEIAVDEIRIPCRLREGEQRGPVTLRNSARERGTHGHRIVRQMMRVGEKVAECQ
jgi:hypothetical protein